jgi:hypothetical protein
MIHPLILWQVARQQRNGNGAVPSPEGARRRASDRRSATADAAPAPADLAGAGRLDVVVTSRTNRAEATCDAPNCAGHRTRA